MDKQHTQLWAVAREGLARVAESQTAENSRQERAKVNVTKTEENAREKSGVQAVGSTRQGHPSVCGSLSICCHCEWRYH